MLDSIKIMFVIFSIVGIDDVFYENFALNAGYVVSNAIDTSSVCFVVLCVVLLSACIGQKRKE
ncbi:hypothetical protein DSM19430T_25640 [Desulfovibrio psychrotolerans]|uniref:Uncharacterized protein n=1 Tax=Desulfovibrio psychrotolerans TaxID=415242 RepID=A0A7J0BVY6_9BACT|nr:hypothetical protein DSM19430T_25640 [Desulfovibrio psychrotolerans]